MGSAALDARHDLHAPFRVARWRAVPCLWAGDKMIGAIMNASRAIMMRSERVGSSTVLSRLMQMVALADTSNAAMYRCVPTWRRI